MLLRQNRSGFPSFGITKMTSMLLLFIIVNYFSIRHKILCYIIYYRYIITHIESTINFKPKHNKRRSYLITIINSVQGNDDTYYVILFLTFYNNNNIPTLCFIASFLITPFIHWYMNGGMVHIYVP